MKHALLIAALVLAVSACTETTAPSALGNCEQDLQSREDRSEDVLFDFLATHPQDRNPYFPALDLPIGTAIPFPATEPDTVTWKLYVEVPLTTNYDIEAYDFKFTRIPADCRVDSVFVTGSAE